MKPPPFEYRAPATLDEAVGLLAADPDAKAIAGGQSLMPILNFRLAAPSMLVDLRRVPGLAEITIGADGARLGAKVRWRDIEDDARLQRAHPLLRAAVAHVAHYQIRNRGTVGGSLAHADPAAELPGIAVTCDGEITVVGPAGRRVIRAAEFFVGPLTTVLRPDEIITELRLPPWPRRHPLSLHRRIIHAEPCEIRCVLRRLIIIRLECGRKLFLFKAIAGWPDRWMSGVPPGRSRKIFP